MADKMKLIFSKNFIKKLNVKYYSSMENVLQNNDVQNGKNVGNELSFENIPSPRRLPLFGTTLDLLLSGSAQNLHKYIDNRHKELGPIFREELGATYGVFVSSPHLMRSVFLYEGQYPTHPLPEAWIIYNKKFQCRRGLFFMDGEEWLHNRKIMNKFLLHGSITWIMELIDQVTENLMKNWRNECAASNQNDYLEIDKLEDKLYRWSIDVIISIMFGIPANMLSTHFQEIVRRFSMNVHKIFTTSSQLGAVPVKLFERYNLKPWRQFEDSVTDTLYLGNKIVDIALKEVNERSGLFGLLRESNVPLDDIRRIFVDFIIAAGDTTAFATQWALHLVSKHVDVQETARKVISESIDEETSYIRGIVRETLRLYPVAPFIGRFLATNAVIGGYKIDKGTLVLLSLYTSGRSEENFPEALKFIPTRWFRNGDKKLDYVNHAHGTLPFAIGSRSCIGRRIALGQMHSFLNKVLTNFHLKSLNDDDVEIIMRLVAVPDKVVKIGIKPVT